MKIKTILLSLFVLLSIQTYSQKFNLGDRLSPNSSNFKLRGISSSTGVSTYHYVGAITDNYFYNKRIGHVIVGFKNGIIVSTIYNLIPEKGDVGVPKTTLALVQKGLPYPMAHVGKMYGVNIDNVSYSLSRTRNALTFHKDRIMVMSTIKNSLLRN